MLILVTRVFRSESLGEISSNFGGVVSFLPPVGGTILAQPESSAKDITTKKVRKGNNAIENKNKDITVVFTLVS
jgi:hypothetical protein